MKIYALNIPELKVLEPEIFNDNRGYFFESFNNENFNKLVGEEITFVQDNQSKSKKGVLRGLHYQEPPYEQGKLIRVISGEIFDVAVDLRKNSKTYLSWNSIILSSNNKKQFWIPPGFAHGFLTISHEAEILYKVTNYYSKEHEKTINWKKNNFKIKWPMKESEIILSKKDD